MRENTWSNYRDLKSETSGKRSHVMQKRYNYRKKIDTKMEMVNARFAKFKAEAKHYSSDDLIGHAKHVEKIEKDFEASKAKLRELDEAHDDAWEGLADGVENTWKALQATLDDVIENFKTQPQRVGQQKSDEGVLVEKA